MTLRARLLIGLVTMVLALSLAGLVVARTQQRFTERQLDRQLSVVLPAVPRLIRAELAPQAPGAGPPAGPLDAVVADLYLGYVAADGSVVTVAAPLDDPEVRPALPADLTPGRFTTVATSAGRSPQMRIGVSEPRPGLRLVVGVTTSRVEAANRRLLVALAIAAAAVMSVLSLVVWWVLRLGLRPIRIMTDTAEALAAGAVTTRAPRFAAGTEADRLGLAINRLVDTSQTAETRLRRFVADASHELRTPLTTLRGYTGLYSAGALRNPAELEDAMRRISQESARMNHLVDDLFLLAELDEGRPLDGLPVDLAVVVTDVASDLRAVQPQRPIELHVPTSTGVPPTVVLGDVHRLTQAVTAYTSNALRHTPADIALALRVVRDGGWVVVEVADQGPGIPPEHAAHLFERFYRVDAARTRAGGGSGLGLALAAAIVDAHGGTYGVTSQPGVGSTFWLRIPAAPNAPNAN
ncbi:MAG: ATP-binding protein [Acidimicrobiales bacterium]